MAQKLTKEQVEHVAKLARIEITEEEKEQYASELSGILEYIERINQIDTEGVKPTFQPKFNENQNDLLHITRDDDVEVYPHREKLLDAAPEREGDYIKVKSVLK